MAQIAKYLSEVGFPSLLDDYERHRVIFHDKHDLYCSWNDECHYRMPSVIA